MALPVQYSLMHSEYNEFLEALIGEGRNGMPISVISAFARFDIDPWGEAERLSDLSREGAVAALGAFIDRLPDGAWQRSDASAIAARLAAAVAAWFEATANRDHSLVQENKDTTRQP